MKRPAILLAVMGALMSVPSAQARVTRPPLPSPMPAVVNAACPDERIDETRSPGCYVALAHTIYVAPTGTDRRFVYWHEMGHAFDATMLDAGERAKFTRLVRLTGRAWWAEQGTDPGELFADAYATCALRQRPVNGEFTVNYGYMPRSNEEQREMCRFIARAGR